MITELFSLGVTAEALRAKIDRKLTMILSLAVSVNRFLNLCNKK